MKKNLIALMLLIFAFGLGFGVNNIALSNIDSSKIAYIDINKLTLSSKTIKQAVANREKQTAEMLKWYDIASLEIQKQDTKENKDILVKKYEAQLTQKKKIIKDAYSKEINKANNQIETVISQKAKELGYEFVFRKDALIVGGTDITAHVLPLVK